MTLAAEMTETATIFEITPVPYPVIVLPWAVLVADNQRHEILKGRGGGRRIGLTAKYRNALQAASLLVMSQWKRRGTIRTSVAVTLVLHEPDKRRRDVGNYVKLACDCLTRVCFVDDSQIDRLTVVRGPLDRFNPRAEITVQPL